jgi:hypothetical protein
LQASSNPSSTNQHKIQAELHAALGRGEIKLSYSVRAGFSIHYRESEWPLSPVSVSKLTSKFARTLSLSPYFAATELKQLSNLSLQLERELLKRSPVPAPIINQIKLWFQKSVLRQAQLKEWLKAAPYLFVSDILREQKFEDW